MPWIAEAHRLMQAGDQIAMERLALTQVFQQLDHYNALHEFDFEAVAIYVLRWVIVERWSRYNADDAAERLKRTDGARPGPGTAGADRRPPGPFPADTSSAFEGAPS